MLEETEWVELLPEGCVCFCLIGLVKNKWTPYILRCNRQDHANGIWGTSNFLSVPAFLNNWKSLKCKRNFVNLILAVIWMSQKFSYIEYTYISGKCYFIWRCKLGTCTHMNNTTADRRKSIVTRVSPVVADKKWEWK